MFSLNDNYSISFNVEHQWESLNFGSKESFLTLIDSQKENSPLDQTFYIDEYIFKIEDFI